MSILVSIPNPATLIISSDVNGPEIIAWRDNLKRRVPGYQFTKAWRDKYWDGYYRPGKLKSSGLITNLIVSRGLLSSFRDYAKTHNLNVKYKLGYVPMRTQNTDTIPKKIHDRLRDYQIESIDLILQKKWGKVALATNAGKGAIIGLVGSLFTEHKTLILTDEVSVFQALEDELANWLPKNKKLGIVSSGQKVIPASATITLGMIPTILRRVKSKDKKEQKAWCDWLSSMNVLLLDEADKATADSWKTVLDKAVNSEIRIGFSGSFPEEKTVDHIKIEELLGPELLKVKNIELVNRNISVRPKIKIYSFNSKSQKDLSELATHAVYDELVCQNEARNEYVCSLLEPSMQNVIVVNFLAHGEMLSELIPNSMYLSGKDSKANRQDILTQFKEKQFSTLITTRILDRGSNMLGNTGCLIFASGAGSARQVIQRIGRGLRKGEGKTEIIIKDVFDVGHKFLEKANDRRIEVYKNEEFDIEFV